MSDYDDPLHDEREEMDTLKRSAPYPPGQMIRGTWYDDAPSRAEAERDK